MPATPVVLARAQDPWLPPTGCCYSLAPAATAAQVGGGPTGVEVAAELMDLVEEDVAHKLPHIEVGRCQRVSMESGMCVLCGQQSRAGLLVSVEDALAGLVACRAAGEAQAAAGARVAVCCLHTSLLGARLPPVHPCCTLHLRRRM